VTGALLLHLLSEQPTTPLIPAIVWSALGVLGIVSLWDDLRSLPPGLRLVVQLVISGVIVWIGRIYWNAGEGLPLLLCQIITMLALVWLMNLYNFMDGMDGFAAGMAIIGFSTFAIVGAFHGDEDFAWLNGLVVVSVVGFWVWNFPPAKIFLGDCGATLLGALAGVMALVGMDRGLFPLWVPVLVFSPFWVDATYTLAKRVCRGEKFWLPHRSHFYQRLVTMGLGHRKVVLVEYGIMLACSATVILPLAWGVDYNLLSPVVWACLYMVMLVWLERRLTRPKGTLEK